MVTAFCGAEESRCGSNSNENIGRDMSPNICRTSVPRRRCIMPPMRPSSALISPPRNPTDDIQPRRPIVEFVLQPPPYPCFHIPELVMAKIVSFVAEEGVDYLKDWIRAGPEGKSAVFSSETLSSVRLDRSADFIEFAHPYSSYFGLYIKCHAMGNPYALYAESILQAFRLFDLEVAISILDGIRNQYPLAELLFIMLNCCAGTERDDVYCDFRRKYNRYRDVAKMADSLLYHINLVSPRRAGTYADTWHFKDFPVCWDEHELLVETNEETCLGCILYLLSKDVCLLS